MQGVDDHCILRAVTDMRTCRNHTCLYILLLKTRVVKSFVDKLRGQYFSPSSPFSLAIHSFFECISLNVGGRCMGLMHFAVSVSKGVEPTDHCRSQ